MSTILTKKFASERFEKDQLWMVDNLLLETQMGSHAYGCQNENSDVDIVGIVMDQHQSIYPQAYGLILGFDETPRFTSVEYKGEDKRIILDNGKDCEGVWHSLTDFFTKVENGSPSLTEVLFAKRNLVHYGHEIGFILRDNRKLFLSMRMFTSFKGYTFQQLKRIRNHKKEWEEKHTCDNPKREELFIKHGYDVKQSYHTLRLVDLIDQLVKIGDLDLMRNNEECKAMRRGEWGSFEDLEKYIMEKVKELETYANTHTVAVPLYPPHEPLHELLQNCIERYYGSEAKMQRQGTEYVTAKMVVERLDRIEKLIKEGN